MIRHRMHFGAWLLALASLIAPESAQSQVATAVVLGTVQDPSGAAVPGAEVTLTSRKTGISATTISGADGGYVFPQAAVGEYNLTVGVAGFRRYERTGIVLNVNQKARVDVTLELGQMNESVTVAADAALVNTVDGEVGQTVVQKNIVDLPLKGRQFLELALLTTGAVNATSDLRATNQGIAPAVNGNSPERNSYTLNGASNRQMHNGYFGVVPSVDSVEEFKLQSGSFNAEYGQAGGAIVNVVTKSGTNAFHGNLYEFLRNDALNARNFFNPVRSQVRQNQFGATLGGPILRNRTFFFVNYEGFRERRAGTRASRFPTPAELSGDLSSFAAAVRDPVAGTNFPGNKIPDSRIDPISKKFAGYFPAVTPAPAGVNNYINNRPAAFDNDSFGFRIDHKLTARDNIFVAYNYDNGDGITPGPVAPAGPGDVLNTVRNSLASLTHNHVFTPTSVNELRFSYLRFYRLTPDGFKGKDFPTELGITGITSDPSIRNRFPEISFGQGISGLPRSVDGGWIDNIFQFQDNFSWVRPRHSLKFGFGYSAPRNISPFIANAPVGYGFSGRFSGNSIADFLMGYADTSNTFLRGGIKRVVNRNYSLYAQDQWQVSRNLTITYGLRWELHTPYEDPSQEASSVNTRTGALRVTQGADITEFQKIYPYPIERLSSRTLWQTNACCMGPLMPRFGFAWQMPGSIVVRGGYAMSLDTEVGNMLNGALAAPAWLRVSLSEIVFPGIGYNTLRASMSNIFPVPIQPVEDNFREGYGQSWNLTVEKQLASKDLVSVAYVGSKGTNLLGLTWWNEAPPGPGSIILRRPFPQFGTATLFGGFGASNYHSLQAKAERRFSSGVGYLTGYTYSKGLGNISTVNETRLLTASNPASGRGRLGYDARQRFTGALVYELPFGKGKRFGGGASGFLNSLIGGWQVNTITTFQTGFPINLGVTPCNLNGLGNRCVPHLVGANHGNLSRGDRNVTRWFDTAAFAAPAAFTQGNQQQFTLDAPGINNWDTSFVKNTTLTERSYLQFRAEFFNFFNHTRFNAIGNQLGATNFGRVLSSLGEREIQLALKLYF